jgi:hypothetical protein
MAAPETAPGLPGVPGEPELPGVPGLEDAAGAAPNAGEELATGAAGDPATGVGEMARSMSCKG